MIEKPAITEQPIAKLLSERWSGRAYDPDTPVSAEHITALCEAARWAPSCFGDQPWRYIIWDKFDDFTSWEMAWSCLSPGNQEWAANAPLLILAASVQTFSHNDAPNRWAGYDSGAASLNLCLQATQLGLMSHQMGGFEPEKLRETFTIPNDIAMWAMIAVGHAALPDTLTPEQLERELKERERRPLSQHFLRGGWHEK